LTTSYVAMAAIIWSSFTLAPQGRSLTG